MQTAQLNSVKILLHFPKHGKYRPAKEGEFIYVPDLGERYVYEGRTLSVEEFNKLPPYIFEENRYSERPRIELVAADPEPMEVKAEAEPEPKPKPQPAKRARRKRVSRKDDPEVRKILESIS
jgi:hypothetical protein